MIGNKPARDKIFISYRRMDSEDTSGRLYEKIKTIYGSQKIFKDVDSIRYGDDFKEKIISTISETQIMLVIIGRQWQNAVDENGNSRLHNPKDYVRIEIELGLSNPEIIVVPVLVGRAYRPDAAKLPHSLRRLVELQELNLRPDPDFENDFKRLKDTVDIIGLSNKRRKIASFFVAACLLLTVIVLTGLYLRRNYWGTVKGNAALAQKKEEKLKDSTSISPNIAVQKSTNPFKSEASKRTSELPTEKPKEDLSSSNRSETVERKREFDADSAALSFVDAARFYSDKDFKNAAIKYKDAITFDPDRATTTEYFYWGLANYQYGMSMKSAGVSQAIIRKTFNEAATIFQSVIEKNREWPYAYYWKGKCIVEAGGIFPASPNTSFAGAYEKFINLTKNAEPGKYNSYLKTIYQDYTKFYVNYNNKTEAKNYATKLRELDPGNELAGEVLGKN